MGLLDELEQEAARRRAETAALAAAHGDREQIWAQQLAPAMAGLADYLEKLTTNLGFLKRRARFEYALAGYGAVVAYADPEFQLKSAPTKIVHEITLEWAAQVATEECPMLDVEGIPRIKALLGLFQGHRLSGLVESRKNANGEAVWARFQARGRVPLRVQVTAEQETGLARMQFTNLEGFGSSGRSFTAEQLNPELFDALGRFITREDLEFARERLPEDLRKQLRSRIERDQLKREWEQKLSRQLEEDEARVLATMAPGARAGSFLGRLRLAALKLVGR